MPQNKNKKFKEHTSHTSHTSSFPIIKRPPTQFTIYYQKKTSEQHFQPTSTRRLGENKFKPYQRQRKSYTRVPPFWLSHRPTNKENFTRSSSLLTTPPKKRDLYSALNPELSQQEKLKGILISDLQKRYQYSEEYIQSIISFAERYDTKALSFFTKIINYINDNKPSFNGLIDFIENEKISIISSAKPFIHTTNSRANHTALFASNQQSNTITNFPSFVSDSLNTFCKVGSAANLLEGTESPSTVGICLDTRDNIIFPNEEEEEGSSLSLRS